MLFALYMPENEPRENIPENQVVYQDVSSDGRLTLTVWRDAELDPAIARNFGAMGTIRVYDTYTGELYHEERLPISVSAVYGPGPIEDEVNKWSNIISMF